MRQANSSNSYLAIASENFFGSNVKEVTIIQCVADNSGSLLNKYIYVSSTTTDYSFWFNVGGSGESPIMGRMGVQVAFAANATAAAIATALAAAMVSVGFAAVAIADTVTAIAGARGYYLSPPVDAGFSGFTVCVATPWTYLTFGSETIKNPAKKITSEAKINSRFPSDKYLDNYDPQGDIAELEVNPDNIGLFCAAMAGLEAAPVANGDGTYTHVFTPTSIDELPSFAVQKKMDINSMRIIGNRLNELSLAGKLNAIAKATLKLIGKEANESIGGRSAEKITILCVADVAGSLNNKYFLLNTPTTEYYVWYNINSAGSDPLLPGKTAIPITGATGATAATLATALKNALAALTTKFYASVSSATVTVVNAEVGAVELPKDQGGTGFTITIVQKGTDINPNTQGLYSALIPYTFSQGAVKIDTTTGGVPVPVYYVKYYDWTAGNGLDASGHVADGSTSRRTLHFGDGSSKLKLGLEDTDNALAMRDVHLNNVDFSASLTFTSRDTIAGSLSAAKYSMKIEWPHMKTDDADPTISAKGPIPFEVNAEVIASAVAAYTITLIDGRATKWSE